MRDESFLRDEGAMERAEWRAGTPRDAQEAHRMRREVEPIHAALERSVHWDALALDEVHPSPHIPFEPKLRGAGGAAIPQDRRAIPRSRWRPVATKRNGSWVLSGGWLDAPVPALTTLVPMCEASGARVVLPAALSRDGGASCFNRYPPGTARYGPSVLADAVPILGPGDAERQNLFRHMSETLGAQWVMQWPRHSGPPFLRDKRGWCPGLAAESDAEDTDIPY